jgi:hypothetical protein
MTIELVLTVCLVFVSTVILLGVEEKRYRYFNHFPEDEE